jgi:hypothetical protein
MLAAQPAADFFKSFKSTMRAAAAAPPAQAPVADAKAKAPTESAPATSAGAKGLIEKAQKKAGEQNKGATPF